MVWDDDTDFDPDTLYLESKDLIKSIILVFLKNILIILKKNLIPFIIYKG